MSLDNFTPTIWSGALIVSLKKALIFAQPGVVNRNYEGDIRDQGDTVKINAIGPVTVSNYVKNTPISAPQELTDAQSLLTIDQAKYFNFSVDDVDRAQNNINVMPQAMREAAYALGNQADQLIASNMANGSNANIMIGTPGAPKTISAFTDCYNYLVDMRTGLDSANVPEEGRFVIVSPWFLGNLLKDDRFVRAPISSPNTDVIINGQIRHVVGFNVLVSNNVYNLANGSGFGGLGLNCTYGIVAGVDMATTYAEQIVRVEAFRPPDRFSDAVKGLHVYGTKVIRPEALCTLWINHN